MSLNIHRAGNFFVSKISCKFVAQMQNNLTNKIFMSTTGISPYNQEFVKKINRSEQQIKEGKFHTLDLDNLWK